MSKINDKIRRIQNEFTEFMAEAEKCPEECDLDLTGFPWTGYATFHDRAGIQLTGTDQKPRLSSLLYVEDAVPILRAINKLAAERDALLLEVEKAIDPTMVYVRISNLEAERDAAMARVAALEDVVRRCVAIIAEDWGDDHFTGMRTDEEQEAMETNVRDTLAAAREAINPTIPTASNAADHGSGTSCTAPGDADTITGTGA